MKLFFSLLICISPLYPREVILLTYDQSIERTEYIRNLIVERAGIPQELLTLRKEKLPCSKDRDAIIHLCIANNNQMKSLHINRDVVLGTLSIFRGNKL